jgi:branched-chain amino acid transport system ATP-binding protein
VVRRAAARFNIDDDNHNLRNPFRPSPSDAGAAGATDSTTPSIAPGEQQMLAIGRGIASAPRLLLLDEPSMGLAPTIADLIFDRIAALHREDKVTLIVVEQRVAEALESCDYGYVFETGRVVLEGTHRVLMADYSIGRAYLGM